MGFLDDYEKQKHEEDENTKKVNAKLNYLSSQLLDKATEDFKSGTLKVRDITDMEKVARIFNDTLSRSKEIGDGANGAVPALNAGQEHIIEKTVKVTTTTHTDGEGNIVQENKVNLNDLAGLSAEQMKQLDDREKEMNNENAKEVL